MSGTGHRVILAQRWGGEIKVVRLTPPTAALAVLTFKTLCLKDYAISVALEGPDGERLMEWEREEKTA